MNAFVAINPTDADLEHAIGLIAATSGRGEKEERLAALAFTEAGRRIINWAYNPFITFGVTWKKEPTYSQNFCKSNQLEEVELLLSALASRELTGNAAKEAIGSAFATLNPSAGRILWLCLNKDLKAGVAEAAIKEVAPGLIPTFAVMRATAYEERLIKSFPVVVEPKLDGNRVSFISRDGSGGFFTRTGKVIVSLDHMVPVVLSSLKRWYVEARNLSSDEAVKCFVDALSVCNGIPSVMLDGEMMSDLGFDEVNGALKRKEDSNNLSFNMFDMLTWEEFDAVGEVSVSYIDRRKRLNSFIVCAAGLGEADLRQTPMEICRSYEEVQEVYVRHRQQKHEGSMVKMPDGFYEKKKSRLWLKLKNEDTEDLMVVGAYQGQADGKYANTIGGLIVDRNGVLVRVSGISDACRDEAWRLWCDTCAAAGVGPNVGYKGYSFVVIGVGSFLGRLIEVEFHEPTKDGSLRHPRFVRWRDDKTGEVDK